MTAHGDGQPASIKIAAAKGRPMLSWVGKRPLREVRAFPAQLVERISAPAGPDVAAFVDQRVAWSDWPDRYERGGLLFHGDNKEVLAHLLANGFRGKVDLVYIDPPFDSGADYVRRVQLRGASGTARLDGETYTLGEQIQYTDIWANDTYLQFMYERLLLLKELLAPRGSILVHLDPHKVHLIRSLMDEVFDPKRFVNEIVWGYKSMNTTRTFFPRKHDNLLWYSKGERWSFNWNDPNVLVERTNRTWFTDAKGKHYWLKNGKRYYLATEGKIPEDYWTDITSLHGPNEQQLGFPTQKPEGLLQRIVAACSNPGDIVLDCFIGSGTTAAVAQKLGRRWIGADINKGAIQTTVKRLTGVMEEQAAVAASERQQTLLADSDGASPLPAQLSFTTWRVNDYDLQIQHNEAVNLACEHLGVQRIKTDPFFDGVLGKRLVKIVPFNHPATVLDLQDAERELSSRPDEPRDTVLVALGRELSTFEWLENHNRHRPINRLDIIELRTDPKYGRFFEHRPASARVALEAGADGQVKVQILDLISPSILERLSQQEGVVAPRITDWRSMVDSVMIDPAYDGSVFNVAIADIPERKDDLVGGEYRLTMPEGSTAPIAVRITDMLGEEVLVILPLSDPTAEVITGA